MLKKIKTVFGLLAVTAMMTGCSLTLPVNATSNTVGTKVGTAKATGYLGVLFFDADASIRTAAKNGGITKISTVDIKHTSILNLVVTYETIVTGE
ncbi:TRL-like family protein [Roseivirga sp. BDSF3-8]|uniref:TRL-like family protein n=1 Tax=Roseivirga sp. BDSF3-8 TaxID=3241598 RepID=UPI0035324450